MLCSCSFSPMQDHCQRRNYVMRTLEGSSNPLGLGGSLTRGAGPNCLETWSDARKLYQIAKDKDSTLGTQDAVTDLLNHPEVKHCLRQNWASGLQDGIDSLLLSLWTLFVESRISAGVSHLPRTEVTHNDFIWILDKWLKAFDETEQKFSNCPFT
jgi:hypothetical protein